MKLFRYILIIITIISLAVCFGFSAVIAVPDSVWNGEGRLSNHRNYILNEKKTLTDDLIISEDTVLVLDKFGELVISEGCFLTVKGGINIEKGGSITNYGNIVIENSGNVNVVGNFICEGESETEIKGEIAVKQGGNLHSSAVIDVDGEGFINSEGNFFLKKHSVTNNNGKIYIQKAGEMINGGSISIFEEGSFDCDGRLTNERKGTIRNYGRITLSDSGLFIPTGRLLNFDGGIVTDNSTHKDLSVYTAEILKNEEEIIKRGIDISWAQGEVDWETLSQSGIDFVMIRCGRGDIDGTGPKEDNQFFRNIENANKYGIDAGVYFYSYAETVEQAEEEAEFMLEILEGYTLTYPVVLDMEEDISRKDLTELAEAFLEITAEGGYYPMLYSYLNMLNSRFSDEIKEKYAVWVARLKHNPETDYDYYMWQYSHDGAIQGIKGDVDFDVAYRDFPEILRDLRLNHLPPAESDEN